MDLNSSKRILAICILLTICSVNMLANTNSNIQIGQNVVLNNIPAVLPPEIKDDKITYTILFEFESCPEEQWVFFDKKKDELVIEFYGVHITGVPDVELSGIPVVKKIDIRNLETNFSINGKSSQIVLDSDASWHYKSVRINEKILRLEIWKDLNPAQLIKENSQKAYLPWLAALLAIFTTALTGASLVYFNE